MYLMFKCTFTELTYSVSAVYKTFKVNWLLIASKSTISNFFHYLTSFNLISYLLRSAPLWGFQPDCLLKVEPEPGWVRLKLVRVQVFVHYLLQELCKTKEKYTHGQVNVSNLFITSQFFMKSFEWDFIRYLWETRAK